MLTVYYITLAPRSEIMNKDDIVLGIDTSNYTTSVSLLTLDGSLLANIKYPLPVKSGECGLRQSDALFAHIKNLPFAMDEIGKILAGRQPVAVGVSEKPRNVEGSYMPVFLAGVSAATSISNALGVPLYRFSHQCGHIMAALYSSDKMDLIDKEFAAFHISGGTTELVRVSPSLVGFSTELVGGTKDLNAGQVIDRVGVMLGMPFPAGPSLEAAALNYTGPIERKGVSIDGMFVNLSGLENMAASLYKKTNSKEQVSYFVLDHISRSIEKMMQRYVDEYGESDVVFAGGVMSNSLIKSRLSRHKNTYFAQPQFSSDNAVGIAALTRNKILKQID